MELAHGNLFLSEVLGSYAREDVLAAQQLYEVCAAVARHLEDDQTDIALLDCNIPV